MTDSSTFGRLLRQQRSDRERERLHNLRHDLNLPADDPIWALLAVIEDFCCSLQERTEAPRDPAKSSSCINTSHSKWPLALGLSAGGLLTTTLMAISFYAGYAVASSPSPPWFNFVKAADRSLLASLLACPAGWILFAQAIPIFAYVAHCGWRARKTDPFVGWTIVVACAATAIGTLTTLSLLLAP